MRSCVQLMQKPSRSQTMTSTMHKTQSSSLQSLINIFRSMTQWTVWEMGGAQSLCSSTSFCLLHPLLSFPLVCLLTITNTWIVNSAGLRPASDLLVCVFCLQYISYIAVQLFLLLVWLEDNFLKLTTEFCQKPKLHFAAPKLMMSWNPEVHRISTGSFFQAATWKQPEARLKRLRSTMKPPLLNKLPMWQTRLCTGWMYVTDFALHSWLLVVL